MERESKTIEGCWQTWLDDVRHLKSIDDFSSLMTIAMPLEQSSGYLVPLCELHADDDETISLLAKWRDANQTAYPTRFAVTLEGTKTWLKKAVLENDARVLFLVLDRYGRPVGHAGFAGCDNDAGNLELDNIVRGENRSPGIMGEAISKLIRWVEAEAKPNSLFLRVFADNDHAISFYEKLGFQNTSTIALRRHESNGRVDFLELEADDSDAPDSTMYRMEYAAQDASADDWILTAGPSVSSREVSYSTDAARTGWNSKWGDYLKKFEQHACDYLGVRYAITTSSCTGALHLSLLAAGIGPGDEVIVPEISWIATASAIRYVGARPVFADVRYDSMCLDANDFKAKITSKTKAVIPVHLYGQSAPMTEITAIAQEHGLKIIEDAAPALGTTCDGKLAGTWGDAGCFSFQGAKLAVTGEGGLLVTNSEEVYQRAMKLWDHGRRPGSFQIDKVGWKYKMSNLQAAFGLAQLERIEQLIRCKRQVFAWYEEMLDGVSGIELMREPAGTHSIYWMSNILVDPDCGVTREQLTDQLKQRKIDTRPVFSPMSTFPIWDEPQQTTGRVAADISQRGINLPSGVCLTYKQVARVCYELKQVLRSKRSLAA